MILYNKCLQYQMKNRDFPSRLKTHRLNYSAVMPNAIHPTYRYRIAKT